MLVGFRLRGFVRAVSNYTFVERTLTSFQKPILPNPKCHIEIYHKISTSMQEVQERFLFL